jgi:exoribonuclease R
MGELGVHSGALMADHHIKDMEFSGVVKKAAAAIPAELSGSDKKGRRDLTKEDIKIFTMGESNEDLDNAFSITNTEKGIYEIGIHVTDVSHFIRENTPLEREARERSCAVQLVDKMIAILPTSFTESHCSLGVTNKDRLAFSVLCRFTENGVLLHAWLGKTIIQSFGHVQLPLNDTKNPFHSDAKTILKICQRLQSNRLLKLQGASLAKSIEIFQLGESGYPEQVERINQTDKDVLLQELLIVANIEVAQKICSRFPDQALLYRQDDPKMSKLVSYLK